MRRTEQVQGLRLMKFEEVYGRTHRGGLSQAEAAEVLGVSDGSVAPSGYLLARPCDRGEREPTVSTTDRLGRHSPARRSRSVDEVARVLPSCSITRYWDFTAKRLIHEKLVADHGFKRSSTNYGCGCSVSQAG